MIASGQTTELRINYTVGVVSYEIFRHNFIWNQFDYKPSTNRSNRLPQIDFNTIFMTIVRNTSKRKFLVNVVLQV